MNTRKAEMVAGQVRDAMPAGLRYDLRVSGTQVQCRSKSLVITLAALPGKEWVFTNQQAYDLRDALQGDAMAGYRVDNYMRAFAVCAGFPITYAARAPRVIGGQAAPGQLALPLWTVLVGQLDMFEDLESAA